MKEKLLMIGRKTFTNNYICNNAMNQMSHRYNYTVYKNALLRWLVVRRTYVTSPLSPSYVAGRRVKAEDGVGKGRERKRNKEAKEQGRRRITFSLARI